MQQDNATLFILSRISGLSCAKISYIKKALGSHEKILTASYEELVELLPQDLRLAKNIAGWREIPSWEEDLKLIERLSISLISFLDAAYPSEFLKLSDPPIILYVQGTLLPQDQKAFAIVGTRQCTIYGQEMAGKIGRDAASSGYTVVSGLARGIDTAAHIGALATGRTIALIGSGLLRIYPKENEGLASQIAKNGAVISEFPLHAAPEKHHFPKRNRLVSALCTGILLAEAPLKSGAMITMNLGLDQQKKCFALPGRADVESFRGNHSLIKEGKAKLVENWQEMLSILEPGVFPRPTKLEQSELFSLNGEEKRVLACLASEEMFVEDLAKRVEMPISQLNSLLMRLVLKQAVKEFPGKYYKKSF